MLRHMAKMAKMHNTNAKANSISNSNSNSKSNSKSNNNIMIQL